MVNVLRRKRVCKPFILDKTDYLNIKVSYKEAFNYIILI